ncbi:putative exonuclease [Aeropyrum pernix K1]|uniref:Transcription termination factor FttA n=1 Tax=Aeropyrum pernix (strain ATCC 700893 / DSM 11879 / JCM 9820 / NBRC 100138 / K1) TaxID=272557 RepID=Q9YEQ9_AERPE|nr:beta-CASP ribonuclease aCPSF1 [Aeropyrum pernix]BAA79487.2 putative exonuclease [Aeropyrum pernix K1]
MASQSKAQETPGRRGLEERKQLIMEIYNSLRSADIASIEFEGPEIAVYIRNPKFIVENENVVKDLARKLRKRIVVRTHPKSRKSMEYTIKFIRENVPPDVGIVDIQFDDVLGEVRVIAEKPGKLMGRGKVFRNLVLAETGWRLEVYRKPLLQSGLLDSVLRHLQRHAEERRRALRDIGERIFRDTLIGTRHVRVVGLGSFGEVGRSAILVDTGESKVLLDAGLSPSGYGPDSYPYYWSPEFRVDELDAVVISHAHLDHVGTLPLLFKYGFRGPVYATPPTRDIMIIVLRDLINLMRKAQGEPPFEPRDVEKALTRLIPVNYNTVTDVAPDIKMTFINAGHILGSSMVHLHIGQGLYNILYTADFKFYRIKNDRSTRLLPPAEYSFQRVEALIMEATYGSKETQPRAEAEEELINLVNKVYKRGGKLLIPVMAVGRGQEILVVLNEALRSGKIPEIPIYVDGMVYEVTAVYTNYPELLVKPIRDRILKQGENPFEGPTTVYVTDHYKRDEAMYSDKPAIILSTSGMMNGGPIVEYFKYLADDPRNALAFVSYQAPGTLGRRLQSGEREIELEMDGGIRRIKVNMEIVSIEGFTGHSTRGELLSFLRRLNPKPRNIVLNHGEPSAIAALAHTVKTGWSKLGFESPPIIEAPENLEGVRLYPRNLKMKLALQHS